jgi:hypothetical protein
MDHIHKLNLASALFVLSIGTAQGIVCAANLYLSGGACISCGSISYSLAGATSSAQCRTKSFAGPTDTVFSFYGTAAEVAADYSGSATGLSYSTNVFGEPSSAITVSTASPGLTTTTTRPHLPSGSSARSMSAWIKISSCSGTLPMLYGWGRGSSAQWWYQALSDDRGVPFLWGNNFDFGPPVNNFGSYCDNKWHHHVWTYDGNSIPLLYLDGVLAPQRLNIYSVNAITPEDQHFFIGPYLFSSGIHSGIGGVWAGSLFDIRVYNRVLSDADALSLSQPPHAAYANVILTPGVGGNSFSFSCAAGFTGGITTFIRANSDNSWSWESGLSPSCSRVCSAGSYGTTSCISCPNSAPYSLAGSFSVTQCCSSSYSGPTDTVYSFSCDASEGTGAYSITQSSGISFVPDRFGNPNSAISLLGGSYLQSPSGIHQLPSGTEPRTVSLWIKCAPSCETYRVLTYGSFNYYTGFCIVVKGGSCGSFVTVELYWESATHTQNVCDNTWHHIVVKYDSTKLSVTVDGIEGVPKLNPQIQTTGNSIVYIGTGDSRVGTADFVGVLDDIRVYARALTVSEIAAVNPSATASATASPSSVTSLSATRSPSATVSISSSSSGASSSTATSTRTSTSTFRVPDLRSPSSSPQPIVNIAISLKNVQLSLFTNNDQLTTTLLSLATAVSYAVGVAPTYVSTRRIRDVTFPLTPSVIWVNPEFAGDVFQVQRRLQGGPSSLIGSVSIDIQIKVLTAASASKLSSTLASSTSKLATDLSLSLLNQGSPLSTAQFSSITVEPFGNAGVITTGNTSPPLTQSLLEIALPSFVTGALFSAFICVTCYIYKHRSSTAIAPEGEDTQIPQSNNWNTSLGRAELKNSLQHQKPISEPNADDELNLIADKIGAQHESSMTIASDKMEALKAQQEAAIQERIAQREALKARLARIKADEYKKLVQQH